MTKNLGRVRLINLPPYCPDMNPVEHVWKEAEDSIGDHQRAAFENTRTAFEAFITSNRFPYRLTQKPRERSTISRTVFTVTQSYEAGPTGSCLFDGQSLASSVLREERKRFAGRSFRDHHACTPRREQGPPVDHPQCVAPSSISRTPPTMRTMPRLITQVRGSLKKIRLSTAAMMTPVAAQMP